MKRPAFLIIVLAVPLLLPETAAAQVTRILSLRNPRQSVSASYHLKASQAELSNTTQQSLQEDYRIAMEYAVYRARLLHGDIGLDLRADQNLFTATDRSSSQTNGFGLLYDISGIFLDRFPYPVTFRYSSDIAEVPREFSTSYQQKNNNFSLYLPIAARYLPVTFSYNETSSETDGLELDNRSDSKTYAFSANHVYQKSETMFTIIGTQLDLDMENRDPQHSSTIDASLSNNTDFTKGTLNRLLNTRAHVVTQRGDNPSRTIDIGGALSYDLGRALDSGTDYSYSQREEPTQEQRTHNARLWLQHQLFKSLTTRLNIEGNDRSLPAGTERSGGGGVGLNYHKLLPGQSRMQLSADKRRVVTSNKLSASEVGVFAEAHTVDSFLVVPLDRPNVAPGSVRVWNQARTLRYEEGLDYEVRQSGSVTELTIPITTARIAEGEVLSIDYQILVNSDLTYATNSESLGADFSLNSGKYRVFTHWNSTDQELISGRADQINLSGTNSYRVGGETKLEDNAGSVSVEYTRLSSSAEKSHTFKGALMRSGSWREGRYTLNLTDRYLVRDTNLVNRQTSSSDTTNILTGSGSYSRALSNGVLATLTGNFMNTMGYIDSTNLSLGTVLGWNVRRLTFNVNSQVNFRYSAGQWTSDQNLMLRMSRQF